MKVAGFKRPWREVEVRLDSTVKVGVPEKRPEGDLVYSGGLSLLEMAELWPDHQGQQQMCRGA